MFWHSAVNKVSVSRTCRGALCPATAGYKVLVWTLVVTSSLTHFRGESRALLLSTNTHQCAVVS